jgi:hypothetical protein
MRILIKLWVVEIGEFGLVEVEFDQGEGPFPFQKGSGGLLLLT